MADIEKVINELVGHIESALYVDSDYVDCVHTDLLQAAVGLLKEQPLIVRCKDCKYSSLYCTEDTHGEWLFECCHPSTDDNPVIHKWNWFCADGKQKDALKKE